MIEPRRELVEVPAKRGREAHHVEALQTVQEVQSHRLGQLTNGSRREALDRDGGKVSASHVGCRSCSLGVARRGGRAR